MKLTKPITIGLRLMTPEQKRAYQAQKQREYYQRQRERIETRESRTEKRMARLAAGQRALEIRATAPELTIRQLAQRLGMSPANMALAMREAKGR